MPPLRQRIVIDTRQYRAEIGKAKTSSRDFYDTSKRGMGSVDKSSKGLGMAAKRFLDGMFVAAPVGVVTALKKAVSATAACRDRTQNLTQISN